MLRIGHLARIGHVSVKTLRFYSDQGLLRPAHRDQSTGYRYYSPDQVVQLNHILVLKTLGYSLSQIRTFLREDSSSDRIRRMLHGRRLDLEKSMQKGETQLRQIDAWLQHLDKNPNGVCFDIQYKPVGPRLVASLRRELSDYDDVEPLFDELNHYLSRFGFNGLRVALWHVCEGSGAPIDCEAMVFLPRVIPPRDHIQVYELPSQNMASIIYQENEISSQFAYSRLNDWIAATSFRVAGPSRELFLTWDDSENPITEVQIPIERLPIHS